MTLINNSNIEQAKKQIKKAEKPIIISAQDDDFNRKILECGKFDILLFSHNLLKQKRDKLKNIDSGLNHVLAKIAAKNKISIGLDLGEIRKLEKKEKAKSLSKTIQNIKICRKTGASLSLINYKDKIDSFSLLISIGASTKQAKQIAQSFSMH